MATYYQDQHIKHEDGFGSIHRRYIISDSWDEDGNGIFEPGLEVKNLFIFESIVEQLEDENGALVMDEMSFSAIESNLGTNEQACLDLVLTAINPANRVYVACFEPPDDPLTTDNMRFSGVIQPSYDYTDKSWQPGEFITARKKDRVYKFTSSPFIENLFDRFKLKDLISGVESEIASEKVTGIDSTWDDANVEDKQGYADYQSGYNSVKVGDVVSLDKLLRKLADNVESSLFDQGLGTFNIQYDLCELPGKYFPCVFKPGGYHHFNGPFSSNWRFHMYVMDSSWKTYDDQNIIFWDNDDAAFTADPDSLMLKLKINPDDEGGASQLNEQVWIDYKNIKPRLRDGNDLDYNPKSAESYRYQELCDTFTDFLYRTAKNFGLKLRIILQNNDITIKFINDESLASQKFYFKNSSKSNTKASAELHEDVYSGIGSHLTKTGLRFTGAATSWVGTDREGESGIFEQDKFDSDQKENLLLYNVAPTIFSLNYREDFGSPTGNTVTHGALPINSYIFQEGSFKSARQKQTLTQSKGIFLYTSKATNITYEPANYWVHSRYLIVKIDGVDTYFNSLEDYLNFRDKRFVEYVAQSRSIDVNYTNGFSLSSDGSNPSWKNVNVGDYTEMDGLDFAVRKITTNLQKPVVTLELVNKAAYSDIIDPTTVTIGNSKTTTKQTDNNNENNPTDSIRNYYSLFGFAKGELPASFIIGTDGEFAIDASENWEQHNTHKDLIYNPYGIENTSDVAFFLLEYNINLRLKMYSDDPYPPQTQVETTNFLRIIDPTDPVYELELHRLKQVWADMHATTEHTANYARRMDPLSGHQLFHDGHNEQISASHRFILKPGQIAMNTHKAEGLSWSFFKHELSGSISILEIAKWEEV